MRAYNATAYDVCDAWGECPLNRAVCESDPELRDNCECASYDPWRPDCRYASCGQCNCDWWDTPWSGRLLLGALLAGVLGARHGWAPGAGERHEERHGPRDGHDVLQRLAARHGRDRAAVPGGPILAARGQLRLRRGSNAARAAALPVKGPRARVVARLGLGQRGADVRRAALRPRHGDHLLRGPQAVGRGGGRPEGRTQETELSGRRSRLACLVARTDGAYARQSITQEQGKWEAWMWKERGHWGRWQDVASPLGNASYYGRVVRACADECGGCAAIAASAEELRQLENLERAYGMSGGGPAVAPLGNEADAACFGKTFPAGQTAGTSSGSGSRRATRW